MDSCSDLDITKWSKEEQTYGTLRCLIYGGRLTGKSTKAAQIMQAFTNDASFRKSGKRIILFNSSIEWIDDREDKGYRNSRFDFTCENLDVGKTWVVEDKGDVWVFDGYDLEKLLVHPLFVSVRQAEKNHIIVVPNEDSLSKFNDFSIFDDPNNFNTLVITNNSLDPKKVKRCEQYLRHNCSSYIFINSFRAVYEQFAQSKHKESLVILFSHVTRKNLKVGEYRWAFRMKD